MKKAKSRFKRSKVPHLYVDTQFGGYFARARNAQKRDVWLSLGTTSFTAAKERLLAKVAEIQAGMGTTSILRGMTTFRQACEVYEGRVKADPSLKASSIKYRLDTIKGLFRSWPALEEKSLRTITADDCLSWAKAYRSKVHGTRFNNTLDSLRHIFDVARQAGAITVNPASEINKTKVTAKRLELPSRKQFGAIVGAIGSSGAWCARECAELVEFLAYSGARITEAAHVRWPDINGKAGTIRIHGDETGTKNWDSRSVPITEPMRDLLDRLASRDTEPRNPLRRGQGFVLHVTECREALANACKKVGAKRMTHHDLRHLFATRCIESGVDIPTVSRWLGHKDGGALAMRTYGHLRDEHSQQMAAKVKF
jgi:integrase